jgi:hypothetical protein
MAHNLRKWAGKAVSCAPIRRIHLILIVIKKKTEKHSVKVAA